MVYIPRRNVSHILILEILKKGRENMLTTLCYLEKDNKYLMLHRNKKEIDINKGKMAWCRRKAGKWGNS